ncbi:MAG: substrate-binding domain-containing protein [Pirellulaceae bacterium]
MRWLGCTLALALVVGCAPAAGDSNTLTLATTTSTRDSGLLDLLVPLFEEQTGIEVKVVAVGSGQALELGRRGDADVLLTHAPEAEAKFMDDGHGGQRRAVMHNDFVLVGPASDPADVAGASTIADALRRIADSSSPFVSRGDESGTHMKELAIWKAAELAPEGDGYISAGAGMAAALRMAGEKQAYTLSDRGTFLAQGKSLDLKILHEGDSLLHNPYTVITINAEKHSAVNHRAAERFAEFLVSPAVQELIGQYGVEQYGQPLFFADALPPVR